MYNAGTYIKEGRDTYELKTKLLESRVVFLDDEICDETASNIVAQLLYLDSLDNEDISMYINSPGGVVTSGLAIYDTMQLIQSDIKTICIGQACSMGALLLTAGTHKKRFTLPNSRIMIHQPLGGAYGQVTDIEIQTKEIIKIKKNMNRILSKHTGNDIKTVRDATDRDNFMSANEAVKFGLVDGIIRK